MADFPPHKLGGETDPNAWHFSRLGEVGPLPNPVGHTFPLLTHESDGRWRLIGTGFYVNDNGFFVTARHVIEDVLRDGKQVLPLAILHLRSDSGLFGPSEARLIPVRQCWLSSRADVAFGVSAIRTEPGGAVMKNWTWTLSWAVPAQGELASTYAFPNHAVTENGRRIRLVPDAYTGHVRNTGDFRDSVMVPFPYIEVDFRIHRAASGGPILSGSYVVGINCTEWPENIDHPPGPGFGAQSRCLAKAFLDDIVLPGETVARRVTLDELVRAGCLAVANYASPSCEQSHDGDLVRFDILPTAPLPAVEVTIYA